MEDHLEIPGAAGAVQAQLAGPALRRIVEGEPARGVGVGVERLDGELERLALERTGGGRQFL
jgi:hypothetical protein